MKQITKSQIAAFNTILHRKGLQDEKRSIIREISKGRTESTLELTWQEAQEWINAMNDQGNSFQASKPPDPRQKMFNQIIAAAHEMGWIKRETKIGPGGKVRRGNNYDDLHKWVMTYGYLKKPMNDYTYEELPTLVTAFKNVYKGWLNRHH